MEKSYTVYLTKSYEVARLIAKAHQIGVDNVVGINHGSINGSKELIPEIYHEAGYYCCIITRECKEPGYRIEFA